MTTPRKHPRLFGALLFSAATILLYRAIALIGAGSTSIMTPWVAALTYLELALVTATMASSAVWAIGRRDILETVALSLGAATTFLHAFRVSIFALARFDPWQDFDVRPEHRALHDARWTWTEVWFSVVMSILGVVVVIVIWRLRERSRNVRAEER